MSRDPRNLVPDENVPGKVRLDTTARQYGLALELDRVQIDELDLSGTTLPYVSLVSAKVNGLDLCGARIRFLDLTEAVVSWIQTDNDTTIYCLAGATIATEQHLERGGAKIGHKVRLGMHAFRDPLFPDQAVDPNALPAFSHRLKELRKHRSWNRTKLSSEAGVAVDIIRGLEYDTPRVVDASVTDIRRLGYALNMETSLIEHAVDALNAHQ